MNITKRAVRARALALGAGVVVLAGIAPATASASYSTLWFNNYLGPYDSSVGDRHTKINDTYAAFNSPNQVCLGQRDYNSYAFFGSYDCRTGAFHRYYNYPTGSQFYPVVHESSGISQPIQAIEYYN